MGTLHGKGGVAKFGAVAVGKIQDWTLEGSADLAEDTNMGDNSKGFLSGVKSWSVQLQCNFDAGDAGQESITEGSVCAVSLYPGGSNAGQPVRSGNALVEKIGESVNRNNVVTRSFTLRGNGDLTRAVAA